MDEFKSDHDALITLIAEVRQLRTDVKDLKDNSAARLSKTEENIDKLEKRIEKVEKKQSNMVIYLAIYGAIGGFIAVLLINHLAKQ